MWLWIRQTAPEPYYVCGGCGSSVRDVPSWTERRIRDLPWGAWQVWLVVERTGAELMVNAALVRLGYAQVMTVPPNVRYAELLLKLQREAREAGRGLWATGSLGRDPAGRSRR
ncbi:MAG: thermonuclease family protein [Armatimonadota bacterium]|nr:thermonuclease family protein [Armatimonadota bacterium]